MKKRLFIILLVIAALLLIRQRDIPEGTEAVVPA